MTQLGEAYYTPPEPQVEDDDKKHINIRFDVFNDGTLSNRTNIDARLVTALEQEEKDKDKDKYQDKPSRLTAEERKAAEELLEKMSPSDRQVAAKAYQKHGAPAPSESENSYEGYYSNIAKMEPHVNTDPDPDYQYKFATYVEGAGTEDNDGDELLGYAFGTSLAVWRSGILEKVEKGMRDVVNKITEKVDPDSNLVIDKLTVDVFGFSRGAAGARKFIHDALFGGGPDKDRSLQARLEAQGYTVIAVKICFAGLYDTVSTYGSGVVGVTKVLRGLADNVEELSLHAITHAEETLHLTAADEHRFHFSLTTIRSAGGQGKEFFLPGVHSDIGGGYRDAAPEKLVLRGSSKLLDIVLHGNYPSLDEAEQERAQLIAAGWYQENEITVEPVLDDQDEIQWASVRVKRSAIGNGYSKIPLHIMARYARGKGIVIRGKFDDVEAIPDELNDVKQQIDHYIANTSQSRASDWHHNEPWLCKLRHDYLHFSARMKIGHDPRIRDGKRIRMTYDG